MIASRTFLALVPVAAALPAAAQTLTRPTVAVEATTDARVRGISWSDGKPALAAAVSVPLLDTFRVDARATTLRDSPRHGGADIGVDIGARYVRDLAGFELSAGGVYHVFGGRGSLDYAEVEGSAGYRFGPLAATASVSYAPSQDAIGGDNLYLRAGAEVGVPATPFTVYAHVGRSTGDDGRARATRLRPAGDYTDWRLGVDHTVGPLTLGLQYTATSIDTPVARTRFTDNDVGNRVSAIARVQF